MLFGRGIEIKNRQQLGYMRQAALIVNQIHEAVWEYARAGVTPREIDKISAQVIADAGAHSNFLGYFDYPATICISVNDTVVHGIPGDVPFEVGDLVSFDCGCYLVRDGKQWHGDSAFSVIIGEEPAPKPEPSISAHEYAMCSEKEQLLEITRYSTWAGVAAMDRSRARVNDIGAAIEDAVDSFGQRLGWTAGIVEEFTGHGIGTAMHQAPDVVNFRAAGRSAVIKPGMVLCVEPILTRGSNQVVTMADEWTVKTVDHALACHWEAQVAVLERGICVLNQPDFGKAALAPFGVEPQEL
ncbi:type I methionyl aminopeptidase [Varibaculum vaginae]|uniref:type I methionyl aminopeptidase n=1 Tax=Varibaculum vaginae TaxID=2364797 RepID=UPI000F088834|nr:type I methionyl aminopeptidase [Varibaculum vaginae]